MSAITYRRLQPSFSVNTLSALCTTLALGAWLPNAHGQSGVLEEIRVTATLRADHAEQRSVTVFTPQLIAARSAQHLEDLLSAAPNVNSASGASRGRFFQIRGIGERSQFVEPINASVATILDGIDLTGLGGAATTWDIEQIEILRGPQGTLMGANALAGLINFNAVPSDREGLRVRAGIENNAGYRLGLAAGTRFSETISARVAAEQYASNGAIDNQWLDRDDTNDRDELTVRAGVTWQQGNTRVDVNWHRFDIDNGYDAFSLDNTRTTLSDQPGTDALDTDAFRLRWQRSGEVNLQAQVSAAKSDTDYGYDEDWAYVGIEPALEYSSYDRYVRERDMTSLELRADADYAQWRWVAGLYARNEEESLTRQYTYLAADFNSQLDIETIALFGQVDVPITETVAAFVGGRWENRETEYRDNANVATATSNDLWSGRLGVEWNPDTDNQIYVAVSRGVRDGGPNSNLLATLPSLPNELSVDLADLGNFAEESLLNTELGWRWENAQRSARSSLTLFWMERRDQQVKQSLTRARPDGSTLFVDYTDNAASGQNKGIEWQVNWLIASSLEIDTTLGYLRARFDDYLTASGQDLSGAEQPQAPEWMGSIGVTWQPTASWQAGLEWTAMDSYLFSDRHQTQSPSRQLVNGHLAWQWRDWQVSLWGRNLLDEDYFVRGFGSFGNDPRKGYVTEPYFQYGEPRTYGVTLEYRQ